MAQAAGGRGYDLVVLSDHGMTPSVSYRVRFSESLGTTVQRILDGDAFKTGDADSLGRELRGIERVRGRQRRSSFATSDPDTVGSVTGCVRVTGCASSCCPRNTVWTRATAWS